MLRLDDITLTVGNHELLSGASLHVRPHDRIGLVGRNGTGKTSLLRMLLGELEPEQGMLHRQGGVEFGYLPQKAVSGSTKTVWDEARLGLQRLRRLQDRMETLEAAVTSGDTEAVERYSDAQELFRLAGGYAMDERVGEVLHGLGFSPEDWERTCDTFSGGWQMRIALARLLLSSPDLLLLDEPTNHLDLTARSWLARYLSNVRHAVIVVSHDRHLLDAVPNRTVEIRHKRLTAFSGNLTAWMKERAQREALESAQFEKQQGEIARLERFVERFGAKATKAAQARSKQKALDRMDRIEAPLQEGAGPRLRLPEAPGCSEVVLTLREATFGWPDQPPVIAGGDIEIRRGERWAVLGPNGVGKSTLLHALRGTRPLREGRRKVGNAVRMNVFTQDLASELDPDLAALDVVLARAPSATPQQGRGALGALGLRGDAALRPIRSLSGGQKARVVLAAFSLQPANVLLLDEPTNHLDVVSVEALADAIDCFEGAVIFVTHDRWFVERLATHVAIVANGSLATHHEVRKEHLEPITHHASVPVSDASREETGAATHADRKANKRERRRLERLVEKSEAEIEALEAEIAAIDEALFSVGEDYARAQTLGEQRAQLAETLDRTVMTWEEAGEALEAME